MFDKIGGQGNVAIMEGSPNAPTGVARHEGFRNVLRRRPSVREIAAARGDFHHEPARRAMAAMLDAHSRIDGVLIANDLMAMGVIEAMRAAGRKIPIVSVNASPDGIAAIKTGDMLATAAFDAMRMACTAVHAAHRHLSGQPVPAEIILPVEVVDASNYARWDRDYPDRPLPEWSSITHEDVHHEGACKVEALRTGRRSSARRSCAGWQRRFPRRRSIVRDRGEAVAPSQGCVSFVTRRFCRGVLRRTVLRPLTTDQHGNHASHGDKTMFRKLILAVAATVVLGSVALVAANDASARGFGGGGFHGGGGMRGGGFHGGGMRMGGGMRGHGGFGHQARWSGPARRPGSGSHCAGFHGCGGQGGHWGGNRWNHYPRYGSYRSYGSYGSYSAPTYSAPTYSAPSYSAPAPAYSAPAPVYASAAPSYSAPASPVCQQCGGWTEDGGYMTYRKFVNPETGQPELKCVKVMDEEGGS